MVYLSGGDDLGKILRKVEKAGGKVMMSKPFLPPEAGPIGRFVDPEGNRIGLQSMQ